MSDRSREADDIVVGAGASGCVVIHRLSGDRSVRVLLIEAGGSGEGDPAVTTPGRWTSLFGSEYDKGYATEPEPGLANRVIDVPRGKAYGGSSAMNAMVHADLLPLFKRSERNDDGPSEYRSVDGPLAVSRCLDRTLATRPFSAGRR